MAENTTTTQVTDAELPAVTKEHIHSMQIVEGRVQVATMMDAWAICKVLARSGMVPKDKQNQPEKCLAAFLYGQNVGLDLMTSVQSVAVIGAMPSVWGDAMLALVRNSGTLERFIEMEFPVDQAAQANICLAKRAGAGDPLDVVGLRKEGASWPEIHELASISGWFSNIYSDIDIDAAGLGGKDTYKAHRRRMRKMRARAFTLRDGWPDILKGIHAREEFNPDDDRPTPEGPGPGGKPGLTISELAAAKGNGTVIDVQPFQAPAGQTGVGLAELRAAKEAPSGALPLEPEVLAASAPSPTPFEVQAAGEAAGLEPAAAAQAVHENNHAITEDQHPHDPVAQEKANRLMQELADRQARRDAIKTKPCPDCDGAGGDKETGYCKTCVGSGVIRDDGGRPAPADPPPAKATRKPRAKAPQGPQGQPELPLAADPQAQAPAPAQAPTPAPPATAPADLPAPKPGIDEMQFHLLAEKYRWEPAREALERTVFMTLRQVDKGMPVDLYEDFTTGYVANQVAVAGPDKGRPDILAWAMSHPSDALRGFYAWKQKKETRSQNPGAALEEFGRLKDKAAHIRGADPIGWEKAAVKLGMGQTPMSAEGYKRLLAQYEAMNK